MAKKLKNESSPQKENPDEVIIQRSGASIIDIPEAILVEILSRLPTKSVVFCKSVCRTWRNLISDPQFAKNLFARAKPQFLLHALDSTRIWRTLFLVESDEEDGRGFDLKEYCQCRRKLGENYGHNCHIDLNAILKIPLRNADQVVTNNKRDDIKTDTKKKSTCVKLRPKDHKYNIVNSCNGLLCLSEPLRNDPLAVCNPVTGEFINLAPTFNDAHDQRFIDCGLGFSPKTNQYKVIRVLTRAALVASLQDLAGFDSAYATYDGTIAEVHTLGTDSWHRVVNAPHSRYKLAFPTYLNGALYCFCINDKETDCIVSFDCDNEQFEPVPLPPPHLECTKINLSMGVLGGDLCVCDASEFEYIQIWVMKYCGVIKSWTKLFSFDRNFYYGLYQPLNYFKNGALLMFSNYTSGLMYSDGEHCKWKYLMLNGLKSWYEIIAYTPSFISLKEILVGCDAKVLNVNSRCEKFKLPGETKPFSLERTDMVYLDDESCEDEEYFWDKHLWKKHGYTR